MEHVITYNFESSADRYGVIANTMGIETKGLKQQDIKKELINSITALRRSVGIKGALEEKGVKQTDIPILSGKAIRDACMLTNPRKSTKRDIEVIYEESM